MLSLNGMGRTKTCAGAGGGGGGAAGQPLESLVLCSGPPEGHQSREQRAERRTACTRGTACQFVVTSPGCRGLQHAHVRAHAHGRRVVGSSGGCPFPRYIRGARCGTPGPDRGLSHARRTLQSRRQGPVPVSPPAPPADVTAQIHGTTCRRAPVGAGAPDCGHWGTGNGSTSECLNVEQAHTHTHTHTL